MIPVAAGVLRRPDGAVLINQRPPGKIAAGRWEFPGGKREAGEDSLSALRRELDEELGITLRQARPLIRIRHDYRDRIVELDTWLVEAWDGEPRGREGQALTWALPQELSRWDLLAADAPIVTALCLPAELPVTGPYQDDRDWLAAIDDLLARGHRLIRLRATELDDADYGELARRTGEMLATAGAGCLVDRPGLDLLAPGIAGRHLRVRDVADFDPDRHPPGRWLFAACHDAAQAKAAVAKGAAALVLGSVKPSNSHPGVAALGWEAFSALVTTLNVPVYGIGGLMPADLPAAHAAGAQGIAGIRAYWASSSA